jgi:hypothetical protein
LPQPVRAGDLLGRQLLRPIEAQHVLGRVAALVRQPDGAVLVVVNAGGLLGFGTRPVAVPLEAIALLGEHVALMDLSPGSSVPCRISTRLAPRPCRLVTGFALA